MANADANHEDAICRCPHNRNLKSESSKVIVLQVAKANRQEKYSWCYRSTTFVSNENWTN